MTGINSVFGKKGVTWNSWEEKRRILRHYNRLAMIYDSLYGEEQSSKIDLILKIFRIGCEDVVLDAGCGTGLLLEHIAMRVNHFIGIDFAGEPLKVAKERSCRLGVKHKVSLIRADVDNPPFRDCVFDKVFALTLIQNLSDPYKTLKEMMRVMKDCSQIVVTGLKKRFNKEKFSELIGKTGCEHVFTDGQIRDLIAVIQVNKVKNKYGQKEKIER